MAWLRMDDFWTLRPKEILENKRHLFECKDSKSDSGHSLLVHVAATHAAIVNGNRRFYRPDKMQEGTHTFLPSKREDGTVLKNPNPVLIGHNEDGDVVGRVLQAKYHDESYKYHAEFSTIKDFVFYQRDGRKRLDVFKSVDWIVENLAPLKDYTGLGYIDLGLKLTNPESIRKVLADEYLSVSVGFKTDSAICSACHTDWADDGKCEHSAGEMVDGKPMFLISGAMNFEEVSFVNFGADPFATVLSKDKFTDSQKRTFFLGLSVQQQSQVAAAHKMTDALIFESDIALTEETMSVAIDVTELNKLSDELKSADLTAVRAQEIKTTLAGWEPETDALKTKKRSLVSTVNAKIKKNNWDKAEAPVEIDAAAQEELNALMGESEEDKKKKKKKAEETQAELERESEDHVGCGCSDEDECSCWDSWEPADDDERDYFADVDGLDAELQIELDAAVTDGSLPARTNTDKVYTAEARSKMKKGSFCGPNKSFPVTNCDHVTAAKRLLGRAKASSDTKKKISACVDRKAKTLKCSTSAKKDGVETKGTETDAQVPATDKYATLVSSIVDNKDAIKVVTPEERATLVAAVKSLDGHYDSLKETDARWSLRWAIRAMMNDWDADDEVEYSLKRLAGTDHQVVNAGDLADKENALNALSIERDALQVELRTVRDSRVAIMTATKHTLAQQIVMHKVLTGVADFKDLTQDAVRSKIDELSKRHISSLKDSVSDILTGLKFADKPEVDAPAAQSSVDPNITITDATSAEGVVPTPKEKDKAPEAKKVPTSAPFLSPLEQRREAARAQFKK